MSGFQRFVADLLRGRSLRRRRRIDAGLDPELRTAMLLRSARPGADSVDEVFVTALHQRLANELGNTPRPLPVTRRRRFVQAAGVAAASTALGVGVDRLVLVPTAATAEPAQQTVAPDNGTWHAVLAATELPDGAVRQFEVDSMYGFVRRSNGKVTGVSGSCTHLGCKLMLSTSGGQLDCPCHRAAFSVTGSVLYHRLPVNLAPLPTLLVRESDGMVQVFLPNE